MPQLNKITLINFRSYEFSDVEFEQPVTVITGVNGAGKTNLLEAISLLSPGRGLRGSELYDMARAGTNEWSVIGNVGGYKVATGLEAGASKRTVKVDSEKQRGANSLAEFVSCIWLTPQMDGIFLESNSERRRFFDRIIYNYDPEHASRVAVYENAMSERLRLLKKGYADPVWLKVLEKRMAEYGVAVAAARNEVIGYLQTALDKAETSFPKPLIEIRGKYEQMLHRTSALEVEETLAADLLAARQTDADSGRTSIGISRTDFHVVNTNKNVPAAISSTGEQKALLLSIILGLAHLLHEQRGRTPIVLLDEVIAHLDQGRRAELFTEITRLNCQCFLTGTEREYFNSMPQTPKFIEISGGKIIAT